MFHCQLVLVEGNSALKPVFYCLVGRAGLNLPYSCIFATASGFVLREYQLSDIGLSQPAPELCSEFSVYINEVTVCV